LGFPNGLASPHLQIDESLARDAPRFSGVASRGRLHIAALSRYPHLLKCYHLLRRMSNEGGIPPFVSTEDGRCEALQEDR